MGIATGTRTNALDQQSVRPAQSHLDRTLTRDTGMTKLVTGALVFSTAPPRVTLAGTMGAFTVTDQVLVQGTALNNGVFTVTGLGGGNYLTLDPPPKVENAPAGATMRTS